MVSIGNSKFNSFTGDGKLESLEEVMNYFTTIPTFLGIKTNEGAIFFLEKEKSTSKKTSNNYEERIFSIDSNLLCIVLGDISDATYLIEKIRAESLEYKKNNQEEIPICLLMETLSRFKQYSTQFNTRFPFFTTLIVTGWDLISGFQMLRIDPSGTFSKWDAIVIGKNSTFNQEILEESYNKEVDNATGISLLFKIFFKKQDPIEFFDKNEILTIKLDDSNSLLLKKFSYQDIVHLIQ
mmetsp:Transcript_39939/g.62308  ORF Transcript_39939/g.62308 Transcript_39939/m.62308 type:complete len:238 (-) Transcript_39939:605-1318(-)